MTATARRAGRCLPARRSSSPSGTANTAKLLQMSGVGPAWLLQQLGVPVVADLPVGENFRDHYSARIVARVKNVQHDERDVARHGPGRPDRPLDDGQAVASWR